MDSSIYISYNVKNNCVDKNMVMKLMYSLIEAYIIPLLKFAGVMVTEEGLLKPAGIIENICYQYNEKDIIIVKNDIEFQRIKEKKDKYEIFNPFIIPRHMVFIANLIVARINEIDEPDKKLLKKMNISNKMVYDEDLDEYIPAEGENITLEDVKNFDIKPRIEMKHAQVMNASVNIISFMYVDKSGNPISDTQPLATYTAENPIFATFGGLVNLIKLYQKHMPPSLVDTDVAVLGAIKGVNKYITEKKKESMLQIDTIKTINYEDESNVDLDIQESSNTKYLEFNDIVFFDPWLKPKDYKPSSNENPVYLTTLPLRFFKEIEIEETFIQALERNIYNDIELKY